MNAKTRRRLCAQIRERDGDKCFYCYHPLDFGDRVSKRGFFIAPNWSLEHVENQRDGGKWTLDNLVLAHQSCNGSRSQLSKAEKLETMGLAAHEVRDYIRFKTLGIVQWLR